MKHQISDSEYTSGVLETQKRNYSGIPLDSFESISTSPRALVGPERVRCFRVDEGLGDAKKITIPFGQYALVVRSSVPVVSPMGRMDVRQANLAYYTTMGYPVT